MKRILLFASLAVLVFISCKKDKAPSAQLTIGTWKAVAAQDSRHPDGWQPLPEGPTLIFSANGNYEQSHPANPNTKTTGTWKKAPTRPVDVPGGTLVLETRDDANQGQVGLALITFLNNDEVILTYYIAPDLRPYVNTIPPCKYIRQ